MKVLLMFSLPIFAFALSGCATQQPGRAENVFKFDGKKFVLTNDQLSQFRKSWSNGEPGKSGPFGTRLGADDQRWTLDFISIIEGSRKEPCNRLRLLSIDYLKDKTDIVEGRTLRSGLFDELWSIEACSTPKRYRVLNPQGESSLSVYEVTNAAF